MRNLTDIQHRCLMRIFETRNDGYNYPPTSARLPTLRALVRHGLIRLDEDGSIRRAWMTESGLAFCRGIIKSLAQSTGGQHG